jgi:hypothetical protein
MTTDYNKILDNCGTRLEANMIKVKEYILKYRRSLKSILVSRHIPFVESFIENQFDIIKMSRNTEYSASELRAIFLRIESQFELYIEDVKNGIIEQPKSKVINKVQSNKLQSNKSQPAIINKEIIKVETLFINPNTGRKEWDEIILAGLEKANKITNLKEILPPSIYRTVTELNEGLTMQEITRKRKGNLKYLISTIIGRETGRNKNEIGLIKLLDTYK